MGSVRVLRALPSEGERNTNVMVGVHKTEGVQRIDATDPMKTVEGIGIDMSRDALMVAYPDAHPEPRGLNLVANTPLNPNAEYGFDGSKVFWMLLRKKNALC